VSTARRLDIPSPSLVLLVGAAGSGKSAFAQKHFAPTEVVSSDACRALVSDHALDQSASHDAFELLRFVVRKRLRRGLLTVADATNVRAEHRAPLVVLAARNAVPAVAIVFALPLEECVERNRLRQESRVPDRVVREQVDDLTEGLERLQTEGFSDVHVLSSAAEIEKAIITREGVVTRT
jgi:protein phosphatase